MSKTKNAPASIPTSKSGGKTPAKTPAQTPGKSEDDAELDGLMTEIEEDLREEELKKFWARHGNSVIAGLAVVIAAVLGWQFWQQNAATERRELAKAYDQGIKLAADSKTEDAITAFAAVAGRHGEGFAVLAQLQKAALLAQKQDTAGALAAYAALAGDTGADPLFRDLASVLYALHAIDTEDPATLENKLKPLLARDNPFYASATELAALLANKRGDPARAATLIEPLVSNPEAPGGVRSRAEELLVMFKTIAAGGAPPVPAITPAITSPPTPSSP